MRILDYESMWMGPRRLWLPEAYKGTDIVRWYGQIERQIGEMEEEATQSKNHNYANKLREFGKVWKQNEITGSINVETIETLHAATTILAADSWEFANYFSNLRDSLRQLKASAEELPREIKPDKGEVSRVRKSVSPNSFGPSKEPPSQLTPGGEPVVSAPEINVVN